MMRYEHFFLIWQRLFFTLSSFLVKNKITSNNIFGTFFSVLNVNFHKLKLTNETSCFEIGMEDLVSVVKHGVYFQVQ